MNLRKQNFDSFTDSRDGKTYKTVKIGNQIWMAENLNYDAGSGCWIYDNNISNASTYGRLYNWKTACNVCPYGWRLPSDAEWAELTDYLDGQKVAGGKMKETGISHWNSPNKGATDISGFSALPGGNRGNIGDDFVGMGSHAIFWSSTERGSSNAWHRRLYYDKVDIGSHIIDKNVGFSVRCIRD